MNPDESNDNTLKQPTSPSIASSIPRKLANDLSEVRLKSFSQQNEITKYLFFFSSL
jgi:hypothetical protein